ncbi:MAG: outer membrane beta-barrel protein [Chlorobi bacterium]|nr:outer membrane beta-barrel protein [Chlorobiota bacterium]
MKGSSVLLFVLFVAPVYAQLHELGFGGGIANFATDIGSDYLLPAEGFFLTGLYRTNTNEWISLRTSLTWGRVSESDAESESLGRRKRGWAYSADVMDLHLMIEYNFLPLNPYRIPDRVWVTPYIAGGLGAYVSFLTVTAGTARREYAENSAYLPLAFGLKFSFRNRMKLVWEIRPQFSFKDNIEGSLLVDPLEAPKTNRLSNDWFIYNGFTITFGWGKLPCYLNLF